jgi:DNA-binding NarL/FixJ family response regulator
MRYNTYARSAVRGAVAVAREIVLVVDDDARFRTFARTTIERAGITTVEASDADEALTAAGVKAPDLVLLDVRLPRVSGYELFRELRDQLGDGVPIIFVSGERTDSYDRVAGLMLGADDYLVKPFDPDELIARVRRSLRLRVNGATNGTANGDVATPKATDDLTPREREVLTLVARGRTSAEIAHDLVISPRTVGTHIQHILAKLGVGNRTQAAAVAHRAGLVSPEVEAHGHGSRKGAHATKAKPEPVRLAS